jgi:hypothetical protein
MSKVLRPVPGKLFACSYSLGIFHPAYLQNFEQREKILKYAVRIAFPLIFASPICPSTTLKLES